MLHIGLPFPYLGMFRKALPKAPSDIAFCYAHCFYWTRFWLVHPHVRCVDFLGIQNSITRLSRAIVFSALLHPVRLNSTSGVSRYLSIRFDYLHSCESSSLVIARVQSSIANTSAWNTVQCFPNDMLIPFLVQVVVSCPTSILGIRSVCESHHILPKY